MGTSYVDRITPAEATHSSALNLDRNATCVTSNEKRTQMKFLRTPSSKSTTAAKTTRSWDISSEDF